ncbi:hypothetical protein ACMHYB_38185 [Sorangium sp. So ce1128]
MALALTTLFFSNAARAQATWASPECADARELSIMDRTAIRAVESYHPLVARFEEALLYTKNEQRTRSGLECRQARVPRELEPR